ncbi:MAG: hypothetical protein ACW98K_12560 [Candidatus Kariarchaeaceae archaeon]
MLTESLTESQIQLIQSLRAVTDQMFRREQEVENALPVQYRSGRGSIIDNLKMINQYVCSCGKKTTHYSHTTIKETDGSALDTYYMNCNACGDKEKITFVMVKEALRGHSEEIDVKDRTQLYPYI